MTLCLDLEPQSDFIVKIIHKKKPQARLFVVVTINNITVKGEKVMAAFTKLGQFVTFKLKIEDVKGRDAKIDGDITITNSNEIAGGVAFDQVTREGKLTCLDEGIGQIVFQADADLGSGVEPIVALLDFTGPDLSKATIVKVEVSEIQEPEA